MEKEFLERKSLCEMWFYQQSGYWENIKKNLKYFCVYIPMGYINFIFHVFLTILALPIFIGNALEYWVNTAQIRKQKLEDIIKMEDKTAKNLMIKAQIKAINDYESFLKIFTTFLLGLLAGLVPLIISFLKK
ncbi:hypothetical protein HY358_00315 [Candidatus Roizmanbacteria bacterium]|nr:hypothetical protein [Candidatus Roizmanbacteria bacterium]